MCFYGFWQYGGTVFKDLGSASSRFLTPKTVFLATFGPFELFCRKDDLPLGGPRGVKTHIASQDPLGPLPGGCSRLGDLTSGPFFCHF